MAQAYPKVEGRGEETAEVRFGKNGKTFHMSGEFADISRKLSPKKTEFNIAAITGATDRSVRNWMDGSSVPSGAAMIEMLNDERGFEFLKVFAGKAPWFPKFAAAAELEHRRAAMAEHQAAIARLERQIDA